MVTTAIVLPIRSNIRVLSQRSYSQHFHTMTLKYLVGLAIVKHIVARHRGTLEIASTIGHGSTFSVILPAHKS